MQHGCTKYGEPSDKPSFRCAEPQNELRQKVKGLHSRLKGMMHALKRARGFVGIATSKLPTEGDGRNNPEFQSVPCNTGSSRRRISRKVHPLVSAVVERRGRWTNTVARNAFRLFARVEEQQKRSFARERERENSDLVRRISLTFRRRRPNGRRSRATMAP